MFNQTFIDATEKTKKPFTVLLSLLMQLLAISLLILIPLVYTQALPSAQLKGQIVAPAAPRPAPPGLPASKVAAVTLNRRFKLALIAPVVIPSRVNTARDAAPAPDIGEFGSAGDANAGAGVIPSDIGPVPEPTPPPPPAPQPKNARAPIRVATGVSEANLIRKVQPAYPCSPNPRESKASLSSQPSSAKKGISKICSSCAAIRFL